MFVMVFLKVHSGGFANFFALACLFGFCVFFDFLKVHSGGFAASRALRDAFLLCIFFILTVHSGGFITGGASPLAGMISSKRTGAFIKNLLYQRLTGIQ